MIINKRHEKAKLIQNFRILPPVAYYKNIPVKEMYDT